MMGHGCPFPLPVSCGRSTALCPAARYAPRRLPPAPAKGAAATLLPKSAGCASFSAGCASSCRLCLSFSLIHNTKLIMVAKFKTNGATDNRRITISVVRLSFSNLLPATEGLSLHRRSHRARQSLRKIPSTSFSARFSIQGTTVADRGTFRSILLSSFRRRSTHKTLLVVTTALR